MAQTMVNYTTAINDAVDRLKTQYMSKYPMWASIVSDVPILLREQSLAGHNLSKLTKVAATDGTHVYIMPAFWRESTLPEKLAVLAHELEHIIRMHSLRMGLRNQGLWNEACDHMINLGLIEMGETLPSGGLHDSKYSGWEEERIYLDLLQNAEEEPEPGEGQPGHGEPSEHSVVIEAINPDGSKMTGEQVAKAMSEMAGKIKMAKSMEKKIGTGDAHDIRSLDSLVDPKRSWREEMRLYVSKHGSPVGRTWSRLDRRALSTGMWVPAEIKEGVDWVVVGFDVSSSTSQRETDAFIANVGRIRDTMPIKRMTIVPFNTSVIKDGIVELKKGGKFPTKFKWGGGTDVQPVLDWVSVQTGKPDCVMFFSDMEFGMKLRDYGLSPLWVSTTPLKKLRSLPKFGRVIEIGV